MNSEVVSNHIDTLITFIDHNIVHQNNLALTRVYEDGGSEIIHISTFISPHGFWWNDSITRRKIYLTPDELDRVRQLIRERTELIMDLKNSRDSKRHSN